MHIDIILIVIAILVICNPYPTKPDLDHEIPDFVKSGNYMDDDEDGVLV